MTEPCGARTRSQRKVGLAPEVSVFQSAGPIKTAAGADGGGEVGFGGGGGGGGGESSRTTAEPPEEATPTLRVPLIDAEPPLFMMTEADGLEAAASCSRRPPSKVQSARSALFSRRSFKISARSFSFSFARCCASTDNTATSPDVATATRAHNETKRTRNILRSHSSCVRELGHANCHAGPMPLIIPR